MEPAAPEYQPFAPSPAPPARTWPRRLAWSVAALGSWSVVLLAAMLSPDPRGFGTHQQLGLPPCRFEDFTHVPCPGCGLTTSFAAMAHGQVLTALRAHLMGPMLFLLTVALALGAPYAARRALPLAQPLAHRAALPVLSVTLAAGLVTFAIRLFHKLAGA